MLQLARGKALAVIVEAFEQLGYKWAYRVVDSRSFGLPQRRERVYFLASLAGDPRAVLFADETQSPKPKRKNAQRAACGFYWTEGVRGLGWAVDAVPTLKGGSTLGIPSQPAILLPSGDIVKPEIRDAERMQGFPVDWTLPAESIARKGHRWKLVGNAVTVDAAAWLGERLALPGTYADADDQPLAAGSSWPRAAWNMGSGRFVSKVSAFPVRRTPSPLESFLKYPTTFLSERATSGFLSRARSGSLRVPDGFLDEVAAHLNRMQRAADMPSEREHPRTE
jgi:DNA (cytosine-5)-methyltransferase 1